MPITLIHVNVQSLYKQGYKREKNGKRHKKKMKREKAKRIKKRAGNAQRDKENQNQERIQPLRPNFSSTPIVPSIISPAPLCRRPDPPSTKAVHRMTLPTPVIHE